MSLILSAKLPQILLRNHSLELTLLLLEVLLLLRMLVELKMPQVLVKLLLNLMGKEIPQDLLPVQELELQPKLLWPQVQLLLVELVLLLIIIQIKLLLPVQVLLLLNLLELIRLQMQTLMPQP